VLLEFLGTNPQELSFMLSNIEPELEPEPQIDVVKWILSFSSHGGNFSTACNSFKNHEEFEGFVKRFGGKEAYIWTSSLKTLADFASVEDLEDLNKTIDVDDQSIVIAPDAIYQLVDRIYDVLIDCAQENKESSTVDTLTEQQKEIVLIVQCIQEADDSRQRPSNNRFENQLYHFCYERYPNITPSLDRCRSD
jgi:hypothetical protein